MNDFDKTELYNEQLKPLVQNIRRICIDHGMPMFFTVAIRDDDTTFYQSEALTTKALGISLQNDHIPKHINVFNGFRTVPATERMELDMDPVNEIDF